MSTVLERSQCPFLPLSRGSDKVAMKDAQNWANIDDDEAPKCTERTEEHKIVTPIAGAKFYAALGRNMGISLARIIDRVFEAFTRVKSRKATRGENAQEVDQRHNSTKPYCVWYSYG